MAKFFTMGIYGTSRDSFLSTLEENKITDFCDIRLRRGLRGSLYKYGNAKELEATLEKMGIAYRHVQDLAPTNAIREKQFQADKERHISSGRQREEISPAYAAAYKKQVLDKFDLDAFMEEFATKARVVLFCVEHDAKACHRGIVANAIKDRTGKSVPDITPD